jgi:RNA-binding protein Musashi
MARYLLVVSRGKRQKNHCDGILNSMGPLRPSKVRLRMQFVFFSFYDCLLNFFFTYTVMKNRQTGEPRGFAFVVFRDASTVDLVMNEAKHEINHKIVDVKRAQARGLAPPSIHHGDDGPAAAPAPPVEAELTPEQLHNKIFVGGLPPQVDHEELKQIFEQFGAVVDAIVMLDQTTMRSRGFGFVTFENGSQGAQKAIEVQPINIHGRPVEVKLATPRAEQQKRVIPAGPKHVGLRAGQPSTSSGEFAGLAVAFGRNGWKAGYGSKAFGKAGWAVQGWEDGGPAPERSGFSFDMLKHHPLRRDQDRGDGPPAKRRRAQ